MRVGTDERAMQTENGQWPFRSIDGPLLVFGGTYGNLEATTALLAMARRLEIAPDQMICTGDVVAYCADAQANVDLIRDSGVPVVMGNCEESLGNSAGDCGCGFAEGSACDLLSAAWFRHADAQLDDDARAWMRALPRRVDVLVGGKRLAVVHGSVSHINQFVFASTAEEEIAAQIALAGTDGILAGHCGLPFTRWVDGRLWHNSGAVGMPANDGTRRVWYSLIVPGPQGLDIQHRSLDYDHATAAGKMRRAGLPAGYADALSSGLWPSCDVLPPAELSQRGRKLAAGSVPWDPASDAVWPRIEARGTGTKFSDPEVTANGERRASVALAGLTTLWINTGTLCNIACANCYIESSPRNDRLAYIGRGEISPYLDEARAGHPELRQIGLTGGEPFMNPDILGIVEDCLAGGWQVLVLTNAMKPMQLLKAPLLDLHRRFPGGLGLRVSLDHYTEGKHEEIRGARTWQPCLDGLLWLAGNGFDISVAGRAMWGEDEARMREGYGALFAALDLPLDAQDPARLVLFPEMDAREDVPEITEQCWGILGKAPESVMCASARMIVKRKGDAQPAVVSCTLLPYDAAFEMGRSLAEASRPVKLNHRFCSEFCVLGGASCSPKT